MHFRTRRNVVQLVRTTYDPTDKKPKAVVVGRMRLIDPQLSTELRAKLTSKELEEAEAWLESRGRIRVLQEELAAMTLAETLEQATQWFQRNARSTGAAALVSTITPKLAAFRRTLRDSGLLD